MTVLKSEVTANWYNPTSGNYKIIPGSPFANKGTHEVILREPKAVQTIGYLCLNQIKMEIE